MLFRSIELNETKVKLVICDTAGQEKYEALPSEYFRRANAIFLVFAIDNETSFKNIGKWLKEYNDYSYGSDAVIFLIANKIDLEDRKVSSDRADNYAKDNFMLYTEVSAKTSIGIRDLFTETVKKVIERNPELSKKAADNDNIKLNKQNEKHNRYICCCG